MGTAARAIAITLAVLPGLAHAADIDCGVPRGKPADPFVHVQVAPGTPEPVFTRSAIAVPPLLYVNPSRTFWEVAMLYWRSTDPEAGARFQLLLPFWLSDCTPQGQTTLTPLAGWRRDASGTAGFVLNYYFRRDATREADVLFPLYWRLRTRRADGSTETSSVGLAPFLFRLESPDATTWISPLGYRRQAKDGWDMGIVPFYFGGSSPARSYALIPPLLTFYYHDPEQSTLVVGPYYQHASPTASYAGLPPLVLSARHPDGSHYLLLPPLLTFHYGDADSENTIAGPFYLARGRESAHLGLVPLLFRGRYVDGDHYTVIPPLLFVHAGSADSETTVVGPAYYHREPGGFDAGLVPLAFVRAHGAAGHLVLMPPLLFVHGGDAERELTVAGPFYYAREREAWRAGLPPLYFQGASPLGHYTAIPPLLFLHTGESDTETTVVGPGFYHSHDDGWDAGLAPVAFFGSHTLSSYLVLPPLLTVHTRDADTTTTVVGPGYYRSGPGGWDAGLVPAAFFGRHTGSSYLVLPPLLTVHTRDGDKTTTVVGPGYYRSEPDGWDAGLVPAGFFGRHGGRAYRLIPPLLFVDVERPGERYTLSPLFAHFRDSRDETTIIGPLYRYRSARAFHQGAVPLYFQGRYADGDHYTVIPPLLLVHAGGADTETTVVGPAYSYQHPGGYDAGFAPLTFFGRHGDSRYLLVVPPLLMDFRDPHSHFTFSPLWIDGRAASGDHLRLIPPLAFLHFGSADEETTIAGPLYHHRHREGWDAGFVPALFMARHGDSGYTLVLPPAFIDVYEGRSRVTLVPPLYLHVRYADGDEYSLIPPLLAYHSRDAEGETTIAGPGYVHTHASGWDAGLIPAAFVGRHVDSGYTLILPPLFIDGYDRGDNGSHYTLVLPPLAMHYGNREYEATQVLSAYHYRSVEATHFGVAPLWMQGRHADGDHYLVAPPLLTIHTGGSDAETTIVGPAYYHTHSEGWDAGIAPLAFVGRHGGSQYTLVLPPLFMDFADEDARRHYTIAPPLLLLHMRDDNHALTIAGPFYHYAHGADRHYGLAPLFFGGASADGDHYSVLPLLLTVHAGGRESETTVVGPGYYHRRGDDWDAGVAPLAFAGRRGASSYSLVLPPLWMDFRGPDRETTIAGPVVWHEDPTSTAFAVLPVAYYRHSADALRLTVFPLFHYSSIGDSSTLIAPLYYHDHAPGSQSTVLFPFYWSHDDADSAARVAFPLYWDFHNRAADSRLTLALPLYVRYQKRDEETNVLANIVWTHGRTARGPSWSFHLFPAFSIESAYPEHLKWRALMGMMGHERSGDWHRWQVFYVWTNPST
jgi:hypothetical protein